jgi:hypothetical protein
LSSSALTATTESEETSSVIFFERSKLSSLSALFEGSLTYKLIQRKPAIVPALSLLFICADVEAKNKVTISEETHLNILRGLF